MSLFAIAALRAVNVAFGVCAEDGTFTAPPAAAIAIRLIRSRQDPVSVLSQFEVPVRSPGWRAEVRQSQVPTRPRPNVDTVTVGATTFTIQDVEEDEERTVWRLDLAA